MSSSGTDDGLLIAALTQLGARVPVLLAYGVAMAIAVVRWKRHPRVSMFLVTGAGLLTVVSLVGVVVSGVLPMRLREQGVAVSSMSMVFTAWGLLSSLMSAGAWGLIIAAVFSDRPATQPPPS